MNAGFDSPSGRHDTITSSLTRGMLRYFTPYALADLLDRSSAFSADIPPIGEPFSSGLPLLISGALSFRGGRVDQRQSALFVDIALGVVSVQTLPELLEVGRRLGIRAPELRKEIVYADAPIPSMASVIFADHEAVPALMDSLVHGIGRSEQEIHPFLVAIVTGFFCAHVHPFLDGNGRWSRVVAASTGACSSAFAESYLAALYLSSCREDLVRDVWFNARSRGLRRYFEHGIRFRQVFLEEIGTDLIADTNRVVSTVSDFARAKHHRYELLTGIFSQGGIDVESIRRICGLSRRAAEGRILELRSAANSYSEGHAGAGVRPPWRFISAAGERARVEMMRMDTNQE